MPVITITRLYGAGGSAVAKTIAQELGWNLLDNSVIDSVAERTGLTKAEVADLEERLPSLAERLVEAMTMGTQEILSPIANSGFPPTTERLLDVTRRVIEEAIARGPVVVVGRGAQEMLGAREDLLHVLCYAPRDGLVARTRLRHQVDEVVATKMVEEKNRRRAEWVRAYWNREWLAPEHYDVCVNTSSLGIEGAAQLVVDLARRRFEGML